MAQEFIIKKSPLQKIVLNEEDFEIINVQYKEENGVFLYSKLYNIEFREKSADHAGTVWLFIASFLMPNSGARTSELKERIILNYDGKELKFMVFDFNMSTVNEAIDAIKERMDPKYR